jgi:hypothetical protein
MQQKNLDDFKQSNPWSYGPIISESSVSPRKGSAFFRPLKVALDSKPPGELEQKRNAKKTLSMKPTNKVSGLNQTTLPSGFFSSRKTNDSPSKTQNTSENSKTSSFGHLPQF